jgi:hypothetical protein
MKSSADDKEGWATLLIKISKLASPYVLIGSDSHSFKTHPVSCVAHQSNVHGVFEVFALIAQT